MIPILKAILVCSFNILICFSVESQVKVVTVNGEEFEYLYIGITNHINIIDNDTNTRNITELEFNGFDLCEWDSVNQYYRVIPNTKNPTIQVNKNKIELDAINFPEPEILFYDSKNESWTKNLSYNFSDTIFTFKIQFPEKVNKLNLEKTLFNFKNIEITITNNGKAKVLSPTLNLLDNNIFSFSINSEPIISENSETSIFVLPYNALLLNDYFTGWKQFAYHPSFSIK